MAFVPDSVDPVSHSNAQCKSQRGVSLDEVRMMLASRKDWTIVVGAEFDEATRLAIGHVNAVFSGVNGPDRPRIVLFHIIEQALAPGAEFGEPTFAWDAGGVSGMTPPVCDEKTREIQESAAEQLQPLVQLFVDDGWPADRIECKASPGGFSKALIADVLAYHAKEEQAQIVVVGRTRHGRLHEALLKSIGERLTHYLPGITVWVVGTPDDQQSQDNADSSATS